MKIDLSSLVNKPISVVCNDAGAANLIIHFLKHTKTNYLKPYMEGPAAKIWNDIFPKTPIMKSLDHAINKSEIIITGTGWQTDLEFNARLKASKKNIWSIAVIDHWVNYENRFTRKKITVLPDEIWVFDKYAQKIANDSFLNTNVMLKKNYYLNSMVKLSKKNSQLKEHILLYLTEPIRDKWAKDIDGEFQALNFFFDNIEKLKLPDKYQLVVRLHPSEKISKYNQWFKNRGLKFILDANKDISTSIGKAAWVVGCQTYAMVIAIESGKKVYSSLPPWAPNCLLPHKEIIHLKKLSS